MGPVITVQEPAAWIDGRLDGQIRDVRQPQPADGRPSGAVLRMGRDDDGPLLAMSIEARMFPRKAPVHLHKSDTFRMALGAPIVVGRTTYDHGEFRLQAADTFYGPERWTDEVGTNQLLLIADRRGAKPYLPTAHEQALADAALGDHGSVRGVTMLARDAVVDHAIGTTLGRPLRAGHLDAGFSDTSNWAPLSDGTRITVMALGDRDHGPVVVGWDRPAAARQWPAFCVDTDLVRLVVSGSVEIGGAAIVRLGFCLQQGGTVQPASRPGPGGVRELWILADRRGWPPSYPGGPDDSQGVVLAEVETEVGVALATVAR